MAKKGPQHMCLFFYMCEVLSLVFKSYRADDYLCPDHKSLFIRIKASIFPNMCFRVEAEQR